MKTKKNIEIISLLELNFPLFATKERVLFFDFSLF